MRGAFMIVIVISLLIVGMLVVKNLQTETADGVQKDKTVERAEKAVNALQDAMWKSKKSAKDAAGD